MKHFESISDLQHHLEKGGKACVFNPWKQMSTPVGLENHKPVIKGDATIGITDSHLNNIIAI